MLLWISRIFSTGSRVYVRSKLLNKACVWRGPKLDKKTAVAKSRGFAHSILWIFMGLSTEPGGLPAFSVFSGDRRPGRRRGWSGLAA
jgi:hypothetical protein